MKTEIKKIYDTLRENTNTPTNPCIVYYPKTKEIKLESELYDHEDNMVRASAEHFEMYLYEIDGCLKNDYEAEELIDYLFTQ